MLTTDELLWRAKYFIILMAIFWATSFAPPAAEPENISAVSPATTPDPSPATSGTATPAAHQPRTPAALR